MIQNPFRKSIEEYGVPFSPRLIRNGMLIVAAMLAGTAIVEELKPSHKSHHPVKPQTVPPARVIAFVDNYTERLAQLSKTTPMVQELGAKGCRLQVGKGYGAVTNTASNPVYYTRIEASGHTSGYQFVVGKSGQHNSTVDWLDINRSNLFGCDGEIADEDINIVGDGNSWDMHVSFTNTELQTTGTREFATDPKAEAVPPGPNIIYYLTPQAFHAIKNLSYAVLAEASEQRAVAPITGFDGFPNNIG